MAAGTANQTYNLYKSVIDEVIKNVKDAFHNEGHDEKVILELKNAWEHRLRDSEAVKMSKSDINIPDTSSAIYPHNTIPKSHPMPHFPMPSSSGSLVGNFRSGGDERVRELEVHSQPGALYRMKQHVPLQQPPHHPMHPYPPNFMPPPGPPPMYLPHPMSQHFEKFDSSLGSPEDKPSKENLSGYKLEGKRQQTDPSMFEKVPNSKRSRIGQVDGTGGGQGAGTSGTGATGGVDVIEDSTDDESVDDPSDNSEIASGELDSSGVANKDGDKGIVADDVESGKLAEGLEGDEELGSTDDDESGDDHEGHFETENMVVCQFKKVTRTRNKWRFHLKDGIMNLNGFDQVFSQATGEADW